MAIKTIKDLDVYRLAYSLAMDIFKLSVHFPKEEVYSLSDQIRRSSRSVAINIREGYAKRKYENVFLRHLNDALGSSEETRGWLSFAKDCGYMNNDDCIRLDARYDRVNAMLFRLMKNWKK
ncbi:MAG: four helix bundle protein [Desulfosarcina sp.]|jgi:four helix bundle protein